MKLKYAVVGSVAYIVAAFSYAHSLGEGLRSLKPNEFGDLLAGIFSPLAFSWFVIAVLMQREELSLQRRELALQREEQRGSRAALEKTSEHALAQAVALREQAELTLNKTRVEQFNLELKQICAFMNASLAGSTSGGHSNNMRYQSGLFSQGSLDSLLDREDGLGFLFQVRRNLDILVKSLAKDEKIRLLDVHRQPFMLILARLKNLEQNAPTDIRLLMAQVNESMTSLISKSVFDGD